MQSLKTGRNRLRVPFLSKKTLKRRQTTCYCTQILSSDISRRFTNSLIHSFHRANRHLHEDGRRCVITKEETRTTTEYGQRNLEPEAFLWEQKKCLPDGRHFQSTGRQALSRIILTTGAIRSVCFFGNSRIIRQQSYDRAVSCRKPCR